MDIKSSFDSQDFTMSIVDGIPVLKFNMMRATVKESKEFKLNLVHLTSANHRFIIIDFTDCAFVDSAIVGVMLTVVKDVRNKKGDILIIAPPGAINNTFAQTGLDRIFKKFDSLSSALASFNL